MEKKIWWAKERQQFSNRWNNLWLNNSDLTDLDSLREENFSQEETREFQKQVWAELNSLNNDLEKASSRTRENMALAIFWGLAANQISDNIKTEWTWDEKVRSYQNWNFSVKENSWDISANYKGTNLNVTWDDYVITWKTWNSDLKIDYNDDTKSWKITLNPNENQTIYVWISETQDNKWRKWEENNSWKLSSKNVSIWEEDDSWKTSSRNTSSWKEDDWKSNSRNITIWVIDTEKTWNITTTTWKSISQNENWAISWSLSKEKNTDLWDWTYAKDSKKVDIVYDEKKEGWKVSYETNLSDWKNSKINSYTLAKSGDNLNVANTQTKVTDLWEWITWTSQKILTWNYNLDNWNTSFWYSTLDKTNSWNQVLDSSWKNFQASLNNQTVNLAYSEQKVNNSLDWNQNSSSKNLTANSDLEWKSFQINYSQNEKSSSDWTQVEKSETINVKNNNWDLTWWVKIVRNNWDDKKSFEWNITENWYNAKVNISDWKNFTNISSSQNWDTSTNQITYQKKEWNRTVTNHISHTDDEKRWEKTDIFHTRREDFWKWEFRQNEVVIWQNNQTWVDNIWYIYTKNDNSQNTKTSLNIATNGDDTTITASHNNLDKTTWKYFNIWWSYKDEQNYVVWAEYWKDATDENPYYYNVWVNQRNQNWESITNLQWAIWNEKHYFWVQVTNEKYSEYPEDDNTKVVINWDTKILENWKISASATININSSNEYKIDWMFKSQDWKLNFWWNMVYYDNLTEEDAMELSLSLQANIKRTQIKWAVLFNTENWTSFNVTSNTEINSYLSFMASTWKNESWNFWKIWVKLNF